MIATKGTGFDIILVSGEPYADHPLSPVGMIARVLDAEGYKVGVIECPDWKGKADFLKLGRPRLFFGITSGSIDSMLVNYTPLKRERAVDPNAPFASRMPDRAVIVYANRIRELHKGARIVLGGIEASLRRFAHYDYWGDDVRRSILLDTRADILVYGPGELQVVEIARRLDRGEDARRHPRHVDHPGRSARGRSHHPVLRRGPGRQGQVLRGPEAAHEPQDDRPETRQPLRRPVPGARLHARGPRQGLQSAVHPPHPRGFPRAGHGPLLGPNASRLQGPMFVLRAFASPGRSHRLPQRSVHPRGDPADDEASGVARPRRRPRRPDGQHVRPRQRPGSKRPTSGSSGSCAPPARSAASRRSSSAAASATIWPSRVPSTCASSPAITFRACSRSPPSMFRTRSCGS